MPASLGRALEEIYAEPESDELRHVYADLLLEAGDPHGEFIALQMLPKRTRAQGKRATALLRKHRDQFLGVLAGAVRKNGLVFERGFLARARLLKRGVPPELIDHRAWSTLVELDLRSSLIGESFLTKTTLPALRTLRGVRLPTAVALGNGVDPPDLHDLRVTRVGVYDREPLTERNVKDALSGLANRMPDLRKLSIGELGYGPTMLPWLFEQKLLSQIDHLALGVGAFIDADGVVTWLVENRARLPAEVIVLDEWNYELRAESLRITYPRERRSVEAPHAQPYEEVIAVLAVLAGQRFSDVRVAPPRWLVPSAAELERLEQCAAQIDVPAVSLPTLDMYY